MHQVLFCLITDMCGISGILLFNRENDLKGDIKKMCDSLSHRGPDDEGFVFLNTSGRPGGDLHNLALGHRRLSIIDLSASAHQPMSNEKGNIWIVYNGEIYNYLELRQDLILKGHVFKSHSDTEVIIHAYEEYGQGCLEHFNGMWAFCLYDSEKDLLFCARDRFAVKPFYFYNDSEKFIFASEIKAILSVLPQAKRPDKAYLHHYFTSTRMDDGPETFFEGIKQLQPAHYLVIKNKMLDIRKYWDYKSDQAGKYDYKDPFNTFREIFVDSVRLRLRSDVPVGTSLSGGLDSSCIVGVMKKLFNVDVKTFSSIYDHKDCDETVYIDAVNKANGCNGRKIYPKPMHFSSLFPRMIWYQDEPVFAPGIYSQWHVMELSSGHVKVLLDGQGADELLGGYWGYFYYYMISLLGKAKKELNPLLLMKFFYDGLKIYKLTSTNYFSSFMDKRIFNLFSSLLSLKKDPIGPGASYSVLDRDFDRAYSGKINRVRDNKFDNYLDNSLYWHLTAENIPSLLHFEDRNSMAHSIEARVPFLDYRLVEFCLGADFLYKINGTQTKYLLRRSMKDVLPAEVIRRKDKKGYPTPVSDWFKGELKGYVHDIFGSPEFQGRGIFDRQVSAKVLEDHCDGLRDNGWLLWKMLATEIWMRTFID